MGGRARTPRNPELGFQPNQRRNSIPRSRAQSSLHRQPLLDVNLDLSRPPHDCQRHLNHLPGRIAVVGGNAMSFEVRRI